MIRKIRAGTRRKSYCTHNFCVYNEKRCSLSDKFLITRVKIPLSPKSQNQPLRSKINLFAADLAAKQHVKRKPRCIAVKNHELHASFGSTKKDNLKARRVTVKTMITCQYCNKTLSSESNLRRHQKTQSCLRSRENQALSLHNENQCQYCLKCLSTPVRLQQHMGVCVTRLNHLLIEYKQKVKTLNQEISDLRVNLKMVRLETEVEILRNDSQDSKNVIARIAEQPKITNTRNNNLVLPIVDTSQETIDRAVETSYNMNHFCSGQKGVARFAVDHLLTNEQKQLGYVCTDPARGTFKHIGKDGELTRDVKASRLTTKLAQPIKVKAGRLAGEMVSMDEGNDELASIAYKHYNDISEMETDNTGFRTELAAVTTQ